MKSTQSKFILFLFCPLLCISCENNGDDPVVEVCLTNTSSHPVSFWAHDGGHFQEVGPSYCSMESKDGVFFWGAVYHTSADKSFVYARWQGELNVGNDNIDFQFTDQSDSLIYDHRDARVGGYTFDCKMLELNGNDTISVSSDTLPGVLSKAIQFNQIQINIAGIDYEDTAVFPDDLYNFQLQTNGSGQLDPFNKIEFTANRSIPNGNTLRLICNGKKD